jgi:hypothetical protein
MNEYQQQIEDGKAILRGAGINFTVFKGELAKVLLNTEELDEDEWVEYYNLYSRAVGAVSFEPVNEWAKYFFQHFNKKEHRIWLKK